MIQLNRLFAQGYGIMFYSPDVLTDFLKAEKCRAKKLCTYFDKHKEVFYKSIENGIAMPIYTIPAYSYTIFVNINKDVVVPDGWVQVFRYDDFFIRVGESNKLCWTNFDFFECRKESIDKRPTSYTYQTHDGKPLYGAVDTDIPKGYYKYDLIAYTRIEKTEEQNDYAYCFNLKSTDSAENDNLAKGDNEFTNYDIHDYEMKMKREKCANPHFGDNDILIDGLRLHPIHKLNEPLEPGAELEFYVDSGKDFHILKVRNIPDNKITFFEERYPSNEFIIIIAEKQLQLSMLEELKLIVQKINSIGIPETVFLVNGYIHEKAFK